MKAEQEDTTTIGKRFNKRFKSTKDLVDRMQVEQEGLAEQLGIVPAEPLKPYVRDGDEIPVVEHKRGDINHVVSSGWWTDEP